jgi:oxalate decarboxylase/phosphoglucose isomerase-like protein (cupin superfamily)
MAKGNGYRKVTWDTLKDYPGETSRIYSGPLACTNLAFLINRQLPGAKGTMHAHDIAEEIYVLLKGRAELIVNDERIEMKPWDAVRVAPGVMHASSNPSNEDAYWLAMATPIGEFLEFDAVAYGPPQDE